jgi:hypothetical protein
MLGICQYPSLVPVDGFSEDNSHVFNKWNREGLCKEWHYQCAKKLLALRLRILGTVINIRGPQILQNLGATSQFKRRKDDVKWILYRWLTNFWHHRKKFSRQGFVHSWIDIVFIVFGHSVGFDCKLNFYEYVFKKLEMSELKLPLHCIHGRLWPLFWLTFMQYLDSVATVKPFQVFCQTSSYCCCCVLLFLLLTLNPACCLVFCTRSFQALLSLTGWLQFLSFRLYLSTESFVLLWFLLL